MTTTPAPGRTADPTVRARPTPTLVLGVDAGAAHHGAADHLVRELGDLGAGAWRVPRAPSLASTHLVRTGRPRVAAALAWELPAGGGADLPGATRLLVRVARAYPSAAVTVRADGVRLHRGAAGEVGSDGPSDLGAQQAVQEHVERRAGRLVRFPGVEHLDLVRTVGDLLAATAVDAVVGLMGAEVRDDAPLRLDGFARPTWEAGRCVLLVQRGPGGALVPFEGRHQRACCTDH